MNRILIDSSTFLSGYTMIKSISMAKTVLSLCAVLFLSFSALGQVGGLVQNPTNTFFSISKSKAKIGEEVDVIMTISVNEPWYVYSIGDYCQDGGARPSTFELQQNESFELVGDPKAVNAKEKYDDVFECDIVIHEHEAIWKQRVKILSKDFYVTGNYEYITCNLESGLCLPPFDGSFEIDEIEVIGAASPIKNKSSNKDKLAKNKQDKNQELKESQTKNQNKENLEDKKEESIAAANNSDEQNTEDNPLEKEDIGVTQGGKNGSSDETYPLEKGASKPKQQAVISKEEEKANQNLWFFFLAAFGSGLLALVTPCVFPMIPMTVSFFTRKPVQREKRDGTLLTEEELAQARAKAKRKGNIEALIFGGFIIGIYTLFGTLVSFLFGESFVNWLATHWLPNTLFFVVFVLFALSFFGMFEIALPSSWTTAADRRADKGGLGGVFFMSLALALVSFSCTGPIVGSVLILSAGGAILKPALGMFGFSLALSIPFVLFALFPNMMTKLPKSGGWLNSVKVTLGFLELALALKFLSIPDQAYHWGILDRDVYLAIWIVIFTLLGFYFLGKLRLPHDSPMERTPVGRLILAIASFSFVVYLIPGLVGAPLPVLSGYLPPQHTLTFDLSKSQTPLLAASDPEKKVMCEEPKYADFLHMAPGLTGYFDYDQALSCARKLNKPVFIDFTGHACVNCREMEVRVFSDPAVKKRMNEDYVVVALYVDDKTELPEEQWYTSEYDGKLKKTIGKQNFDLQVSKFQSNGQPYYYIINPWTEEPLTQPKVHDLNVGNFVAFLEQGTEEFAEAPTGSLAGN